MLGLLIEISSFPDFVQKFPVLNETKIKKDFFCVSLLPVINSSMVLNLTLDLGGREEIGSEALNLVITKRLERRIKID